MTIAPDAVPELLPLPLALLPRGEGDRQAALCAARQYGDAPLFAMVVKGESMRDAGIGDGDYVIARRQSMAENGEIVIAMVGTEEATVKRFFKENGTVRLQPANPDFQPLVTRDVTVMGRVTLAIKRF
jgi:repressor LexA